MTEAPAAPIPAAKPAVSKARVAKAPKAPASAAATAAPTPARKAKAPAAPKAPAVPKAPAKSPAAEPEKSQPALVAFLADWQEMQEGAITAGRPLVLHYEPARIGAAETSEDIVGYARFLPSGIVRHAVLRRAPGPRAKTAGARLAAELAVPHETRRVELWFQGIDATGAPRWDSRFGENYRFEVVRPEPAADALPVHADAVVDPSLIDLAEDGAVKSNSFPSRPGYPSGMTSIQTSLRVGARVRSDVAVTRAWIEVVGFDGDAAPVYATSLPLAPLDAEAPDGARFALVDLLYQGSVATPGSVTPRPDIRVVLYRLYGEAGGVTYTDGVVHRCELATDALSG